MGFAKHVGRVGALAFALGVGIGLGASPGVAFADTPGSTGSNTSASTTDSAPAAEQQAPKRTLGRHATARDTDTDEADSSSKPRHRPNRTPRATKQRSSVSAPDTKPDTKPDTMPADHNADPVDSAPSSAPRSEPTTAELSASTTTVVTESVELPTQSVTPSPSRRSTVTLRTVLSSLLDPGGTPEVPGASPALWVLAAAARRQLGTIDTVGADRNAVASTALAPGTPVVNPPDAAGVVTGSVVVTGVDPVTVTYQPSALTKGSIKIVPGTDGFSFTYTPTAVARHAASATNADAGAKSESFVVTISDGSGSVAAVPITVAILPVNAPPTNGKARASLPSSNGDVRGRITARDSDRDTLAYTPLATAKGGIVQIDENGRFTYTPTEDARHAAASADATDEDKTDSFDVVVSDGHGGFTTVAVSVRVKPGNEAPTATVRKHYSASSPVVTGTVRGRDLEKDPITYTASSPSAKGGTVTIDDRGRFVYTPTAQARHDAAAVDAPKRDTVDSFDIFVSDDHGGTKKVVVIVKIKPANSAPTGASVTDLFTNPNSGVVSGRVAAVDADGDTFTYGIARGSRKGDLVLDDADGTFVYTPTAKARAAASSPFAPARNKTDVFTVSVDDGHGGSTVLTVRVAIAPLGNNNQAPVNGTFVTSQPGVFTGTVTGTATATDPDEDVLTLQRIRRDRQGQCDRRRGRQLHLQAQRRRSSPGGIRHSERPGQTGHVHHHRGRRIRRHPRHRRHGADPAVGQQGPQPGTFTATADPTPAWWSAPPQPSTLSRTR